MRQWDLERPMNMMQPLAAVVLLAATAALAHGREIRLGGALSSSGKYTSSGTHCRQGWTLWAQRLNELGGIRLPGGEVVTVKLPLDLRDDGSDKATSSALLANMLNSSHADFANLDFVIGPFSSGITAGNSIVSANAGRILFSHGASESLYNAGNGYIFSVLTPGGGYMSSGLERLAAQGAKTVVFAHEEKSFSSSVCLGGNSTAFQIGMDVVGYFAYPPGTQNFAEIIFDIKGKNPDIVVGCGHVNDINYLIGQMVLMDVSPKAMLVTHASDERVINNVGAKSHAILSPTQWDKNLAFKDAEGFFGSAADFHESYVAAWGTAPPYQAAYAAAMGYALQKAIEVAGTTDTESVRAALYSLNTDSFYGPISFSPPNDTSGLVGTMPRRPMVTTQILYGEIGVVAPAVAANFDILYPAPVWPEKDLLVYPCPEGEEDVMGQCVPCAVGSYRDSNLLQCKPCPSGTFTAVTGTSRCSLCEQGTFGETVGLSACENCSIGHAAVEQGMSACPACRPGHFMDFVGAAECERCPEGHYANGTGSTSCLVCPDGRRTRGLGARELSECICLAGDYYKPGEGCVPCPQGLNCPGGNEAPMQEKGFYVEVLDAADRSYHVFECQDENLCPAGQPGLCAAPYSSRSCAICGADSVNTDHTCKACNPAVVVSGLVACVLCLYIICRVADSQRYGKVTAVSMLFGNLAIAVTTLQSLNIVLSFFPKLPASLGWINDITELMMFRISWAAPGCDFGTAFGNRLAFAALPPILVVGGYALLCLFTRCISKIGVTVKSDRLEGLRLKFDSVFNASGMLLQTLYVLLCKEALGYLMAQTHAAGPDTLALYPDILMWSDTHVSMLWLGGLMIATYVVGMYSVLVYAVYVSPSRWADMGFRRRFRFAFARWRPNACYWGLLMLARNLCVSMVPAVITSGMTLRASAMVLLSGTHALAEAWYQPWLTMTNNVVEIVMTLLLMLITIGTLSGQGEDGSAGLALIVACFVLIWVLFLVASIMTLANQAPSCKRRAQLDTETLQSQLEVVSAKLATQEAEARGKRSAVIGALAHYDRTALATALKLLDEEVLDSDRSQYKRVRFSFLSSKGAAATEPPAAEKSVEQARV
eukprot:TRINITY_DN6143_c0_g1_i3.p1 TRINITY_DN6143_c0_g1~~TRINITY_DN6143_c0_g1_i3.p1  ORF type:complete len:1107 (-),score=203.67 TRINITY_DN6143_c0_g1_i3:225-3545(-)